MAASADASSGGHDFLAALSHELRNPLAPIAHSLAILDQVGPTSREASSARAVLKRQVGQLARIVDDLCDLTRMSHGKIRLRPGPLDLGELAERVLADHQAQFRALRIGLVLERPRETVLVRADPCRIAQVLGNLLQNAGKFVPPGGVTTVRVSRARTGKNRGVLSVTDDGAGVSPEMLPRLFQPFVQGDQSLARSQGGLGLGLAIVKSIVDLHDGEIVAHSDGVGCGTSFVVRLPLARGPARASRRAPPRARHKGCRVLIIDDNVDAAVCLRQVLTLRSPDQITLATSGPEGLRLARRLRPDIVLCDIGLPGMDGYQVARAIRSDPTLHQTRLAALTGYALSSDVERARQAGFDWHLAKPVELEQLEAVLRQVARRARRFQPTLRRA